MNFRQLLLGVLLFLSGLVAGAAGDRFLPAAYAAGESIDLQKLAANPQFAHAVEQVMQSRVYKSQAFRYAVENTVRSTSSPRPAKPAMGFEYELRNAIRNCRVSGEFIRC